MSSPQTVVLQTQERRWLVLLALIAAGESIFFLPFVLARIFRPTLLEVFDLTNTELGVAFFFYGVVAMASYFFGGPLADRFSLRSLLAIALIATAAGGFVMATIPPLPVLKLLYGYWGLTTILLFWSALIRATREWGGEFQQGAAFGLLDGGRGFLAAAVGSVSVAVFEYLLPMEVESATLAARSEALRSVILLMSVITLAIALLVWIVFPKRTVVKQAKTSRLSLQGIRIASTMPTVWLQAVIIICAYVGYKATDDFSLYAKEVLQFNEVDAAKIGTVSMWMRPLGAILAGYLADRLGASRMVAFSFAVLTAGCLIFASGSLEPGITAMFFITLLSTSLAIFALRGLYYAVMNEGHVPLKFTGSAVGIVSVIGYTPDVFMGPLMGVLLDESPGETGHQHVFAVVAGFAVAGLLASLVFQRVARIGATSVLAEAH